MFTITLSTNDRVAPVVVLASSAIFANKLERVALGVGQLAFRHAEHRVRIQAM